MAAKVKQDWRSAGLDAATGALLAFAERLTGRLAEISSSAIDDLRQAGFSDRAIHDAVQVISYFNYINRVADGLGVDPEQCMGEGHRAGAQRWKFPADPSAWFQKFAYLKSPLPKHRTDRPSGPEVVCSQSLLSRDREGAVQGLAAYRRSRTYGTKH